MERQQVSEYGRKWQYCRMPSSPIKSSDVRPVGRWRLSSVAILVLGVWIIGTLFWSALQPFGIMGTVFSDTFLPVEIVLSLIITYRLTYRLNRSVNGMPPIRFSTQHPDTSKTSPIGSAIVLVGFQGTIPTGGNLGVTIRIGGDLLQLIEKMSLRPSYPSYEIPVSEIKTVRIENNRTLIELSDGTVIRLAKYRGAPLKDVLSGKIPLLDATDQYVHPVLGDAVSARIVTPVTNYLFVFASAALLTVAILVTNQQWPYAVGVLIGTMGVTPLLWSTRHSVWITRSSATKRSPAGLGVVIAMNLTLAVIFVFVSYIMKTPIITVGLIAMATLMVGLALFILFVNGQRARYDGGAVKSPLTE
jgi:hypothetical protein